MDVRISARRGDLEEELKDYATERLEQLGRHNSSVRSVDVILDEDSLTTEIELRVHLSKGPPVVASARHEEARAALDAAYAKMDGTLRRLKEKTEDRRHGRRADIPQPPAPPDITDETGDFVVPDLEG